jgi:UDP-GlcNAc3NAcA epimerase
LKILTILGARPQFIKAATVSRRLREKPFIKEIIVHTGQHYDPNMSDVFFDELEIPRPNYKLEISRLSHGAMTGRMVEEIERIIFIEQPNWVMVYGDTNSTLAGAVAASKAHIPIAHVEAGLRSHNPLMPEEINRVLTDRVSTLLLCPTDSAVENLKNEGFPFKTISPDEKIVDQKIINVGDVMYDAMLHYKQKALQCNTLKRLNLLSKDFILCTIHRQENTDKSERLKNIVDALARLSEDIPIVMPIHPRTRGKISELSNSAKLDNFLVLEPLSYLEMLILQSNAKRIITDSGGLQKEAYFNKIPCITIRDETEWRETVNYGWNKLVSADPNEIVNSALSEFNTKPGSETLFGNGNAALEIVNELIQRTPSQVQLKD